MEWNQHVVDRLDLVFNESTVCGVDFDAQAAQARLFIEVLALPDVGSLDLDPRRVVVLSGASSVEATLRADGPAGYGPVLPIESMAALDGFFASLWRAESMYGWSFIDVQDLREAWSVAPSLIRKSERRHGHHTLHWFAECLRRPSEDEWERYVLQGVIRFESLRFERADGRPVPTDEMVADTQRWWSAFRVGDSRLSVEAQRQADGAAARWRSWGGTVNGQVEVPAGGQVKVPTPRG